MPQVVVVPTLEHHADPLLPAAAWAALARCAEVHAARPDHPLLTALAEPAGLRPAGRASPDGDPDDVEAVAGFLLSRPATPVGWLAGPDGDPALVEELTARAPGSVTVVPGSSPGWRLLDLVAVMDRLRSPGGCPWDAAQTHQTLVPYLLEETYETIETIETGDRDGLREELGDLALQVVFHARVAQEHPDRPWSVDEVADGVVTKLVARHPHVFADAHVGTADQVEASWEVLKRAEKGRTSAVDGVPLAQPALSLAAKLISRAERAGIRVEVAPPHLPEGEVTAEGLGEVLLAVVGLAHRAGLDPESALREAARGYAGRVRAAEPGGPSVASDAAG